MSAAEPGRLGPYVLRRRLGEGGMGVVHLASAPDGSSVAVKELRPGVVGGEDGRARLAREVEALRRVRGLGVAEVLDADVTGPRPYVVTRYVRGRSLDRFVAEHGPLGPALQRQLAVGLVEALACVHAAGVVHRDVKPGNVMLADGGRVVLIDFGLARALDATRLTSTGLLVGTPGYLAPETVVGAPPSAATDVHGWATTLAFAASGASPYGEGPPVVVLDRIRRGEYALGGVAPELADLVRQALEDDPRERPPLTELHTRLAAGDAANLAEAPTALLALSPRTRADLPATGDTTVSPPGGAPLGLPPVPPAYAPTAAPPPHPAGTGGPPWPAGVVEPPRASGPALVALLGAAAAVVAGVAAAPYAALLTLAVAVLVARTTDRAWFRLQRRRQTRGRQPRDRGLVAATAPLQALLGVPQVVLMALGVVAAAAAAAGVTALLTPRPHAPTWAAAITGVATACWGPGGASVRRGARSIVAPIRRSTRVGWTVAACLWLTAVALAVVAEQYAAFWWPAAGPPAIPLLGSF